MLSSGISETASSRWPFATSFEISPSSFEPNMTSFPRALSSGVATAIALKVPPSDSPIPSLSASSDSGDPAIATPTRSRLRLPSRHPSGAIATVQGPPLIKALAM